MRPPIGIPIFIRSMKGDNNYRGEPGIKDEKLLNSSVGGAFGMVRSQGQKGHQGWDIYAPVNTPIIAITDGDIIKVDRSKTYGRIIILSFRYASYPNGLYALYAHLSQTSVKEGQPVQEGDILGYTGTDGNAYGTPPHLHFEIRTIAEPPISDPENPASVLLYRISPGEILGGHYNL